MKFTARRSVALPWVTLDHENRSLKIRVSVVWHRLGLLGDSCLRPPELMVGDSMYHSSMLFCTEI